jgi:hypothetical protein
MGRMNVGQDARGSNQFNQSAIRKSIIILIFYIRNTWSIFNILIVNNSGWTCGKTSVHAAHNHCAVFDGIGRNNCCNISHIYTLFK